MFEKHKTPSLAQARKISKDGHNRRTKAAIDNCINTIDRYIACSAENGDYHMCTWFHNNSGFLTPAAMEVVREYYSKLGYIIKIVDDGPEFDGDREHYQVELSWEDEAAC
jgi:hypothetical protein